jgi:hypothetical protein
MSGYAGRKIENLSVTGNFKHKEEMSLSHKPSKRQKKGTIACWHVPDFFA